MAPPCGSHAMYHYVVHLMLDIIRSLPSGAHDFNGEGFTGNSAVKISLVMNGLLSCCKTAPELIFGLETQNVHTNSMVNRKN